MEGPAWTYRKLSFPRGKGRLVVYADLYRFGGDVTPAPVLVHLGGAAKAKDYATRARTEPVPIREVIARAVAAFPRARVDVLVCPDQPDTRPDEGGRSEGAAWWETHWDEQLQPSLGQEPTAVGLVGHSAGAPTALHLAAVLQARAVATLGGAGIVRALAPDPQGELEKLRRQKGWSRCDLAVFRNALDDSDDPVAVRATARPPFEVVTTGGGPGKHSFSYYASNGVAEAAYRFVLERIVPGRSSSTG